MISPVEGRVSFSGFIQEKQELKQGQLVCFINPGNTSYYAETLIPQYNFGKIKTGQMVLIKLQAYPYQEFGFIEGKIDYINQISTDSGYHAKISLPTTLITNYNRKIQYRNGLLVQADIITENTNILQRLFYNLRKTLN
jgi:HlyD family secretion protein